MNSATGRQARRRRDWRERVPSPSDYYTNIWSDMQPSHGGWNSVRCKFHDDQHASLSVRLQHGGWHCRAGGGKGDLLSFHLRLTGKDVKAAVLELTGVRL